jgi:hypothetical protein
MSQPNDPQHGDQEDAPGTQPRRQGDASSAQPPTAPELIKAAGHESPPAEASISETDLVLASEIDEAPPEAGFPRPADPAAQSFLDPKTKSRITGLDQQRLHTLKLIKAEVEKHDRAVTRIEEAQAAIAKAQQDFQNARTTLATRIEQRDNALTHRAELEDRLREINDEIRELSLTPAERKARDARREAARRKAEAEAAEQAAREAYDNELVPFEQTYSRIIGRHGETVSWAMTAPGNRNICIIKRRDLPQYEADQVDAEAWLAKQKRDELADEYASHCRNARQTWFATDRERVEYMAQWGPNTARGRAYRERQRELGKPETDPPRMPR